MKKNVRLLYALFLLFYLVFSTSSAQNSSPNYYKLDWYQPVFDVQETYSDSLVFRQERVLLHIANEHMSNDNPLFFKAYLLMGPQQNRYSLSGVLNIELLDRNGAVVKRQFHKVVDGMVEGHMELPKNITPGKYSLKAYTRWMRNYGEDFFAIEEILVGSPLSKEKETSTRPDIFIAPEGGTLLSGHENRLVIKIPLLQTTKVGQVGRILDDKKQEVATVNYYSTGIGTTIFKPLKDKLYQLELENGAMYSIPKAEIQGYLLHVNNIDENNTKIRVTASSAVLGSEVTLIGTSSGIRYFENQLDFKNGNILDVDLPKKDIPNGIFTFKLVDGDGTELARRPILIDRDRLSIDIKPISSDTDENIYEIKVRDKTKSPIKTQLALSVKRYKAGAKMAIEEYSVDRPRLFDYPEIVAGDNISTDRKNRFLKDLNIQVSDINFKNISSDENNFENNIEFPIQKGLELRGHAYDLDNKLLGNTKIQAMAQTEDEIWLRETQTDASGLLRLEEIQINGSAKLVFRTKGKNTKSRLVKVIPLKGQGQEQEKEQEKNSLLPDIKKNHEVTPKNKVASSEPFDTKSLEPLIELEEVEVSENRVEDQQSTPSVYGIDVQKSRRKYQDPKRPRSIAQMLSEIPGVVVSGIGNLYPSVSIIRGSGPILWVIDGFPLNQGNNRAPSLGGSVRSSLVEVMNVVTAVDVERIELLIGANATIYGSRGSGGVFAIYTRFGSEQKFFSRKEGQLAFEGYEPILEFAPHYQSLSKKRKEKSNLLYWNPKLETDENGEAIIRIPVLSPDSMIKIEASTITPNGKIGSLSVNF